MVKYISFCPIIWYLFLDFSLILSGALPLISLINFLNSFHKLFESAKKITSSASSAQMPECLGCLCFQVSFECPSYQVSEYPSALQVPKCLKCSSVLSAQIPLMFGSLFHCCFEALRVPIECSSTLRAPFEHLLSKNVSNITINGFLHCFIELQKNFSEYKLFFTSVSYEKIILEKNKLFGNCETSINL